MNDKTNSTPEDPKDGFDLIEYPLDYNFKAMCKAEEGAPSADYIKGLITPLLDDGALKKLSSNTSRTGKFESVTAVVNIKSCLLYTSPSPRDKRQSRMPSSA